MQYSVVLVDDHKILRDGIKTILEQTSDFRVIGEAENGTDAIRLCRTLRPDLVVMDIGLPGISGIESTIEILRHFPNTKVLVLSVYDDENSVVAAFRAGVRAFLLKKASAADLLDALRTVSKGGSFLSSEVSDHLLTRVQRGDLELKGLPGALDNLSPRERQVLRLVAEGKTSKDVANLLDLGLQTVRTYRKTLMKKIGVTNVAGLTRIALAAGLTSGGKLDSKPKK